MSVSNCPYCGKEYGTFEVPFAGKVRVFHSKTCGCEGEQEALRQQERERLQRELAQAWANTGVPKRYRDVQPDMAALESMERAGGQFLTGKKGTGKTTQACRVLKAYVRRYQRDGWASARFMSVPDWLASMRGKWGPEEEDAYRRAASCKLLLLDDIGKGKPTDWALERLFRLIDERYNEERMTVYTSQKSLTELAGKLAEGGDPDTAEAIASRIAECCEQVVFQGRDMRKKF